MVSEKVVHFQACQMATTNSVKQHKLRKRIAWLSDKEEGEWSSSRSTLPREKSTDEIVAILKRILTLVVVKSESVSVRDRLQNAPKNVIHHLKLKHEIPENRTRDICWDFRRE